MKQEGWVSLAVRPSHRPWLQRVKLQHGLKNMYEVLEYLRTCERELRQMKRNGKEAR